jgi:hypothetical protein
VSVPSYLASVQDWMRIASREINGLLRAKKNIVTKTAAHTLVEGEDGVYGDATAGAFSVTLPKAALFEGRSFIITKIDASANAVTVDGDGAETISGAATVALGVQWQSTTVLSNGSNWIQI